MKPPKFRALWAIVMILIWIGCTKDDVEFQDNFPFEVSTIDEAEAYINDAYNTKFLILPERLVEGAVYYFSYEIQSGNGYYMKNGEKLDQKKEYVIDNLEFFRDFIVLSEGETNVIVSFDNKKTTVVSKEVKYMGLYRPFDFLLSLASNRYPVGIKVPVNCLISDSDNDINEYQFKYLIENGDGRLFKRTIDSNLKESFSEIPVGQYVPVNEGVIDVFYEAFDAGNDTHTLSTTLLSSDGNKVEPELEIPVTELTGAIVVNVTDADINLGETTNFIVSINMETGITGEIYFEDSGTGEMNYEGTVYGESERLAANNGVAYNFVYSPAESGDHEINFFLDTSNGNTYDDGKNVMVASALFGATASANPSEIYIGEFADLNVNINQTVGGSTTYEMSVEYDNSSANIYSGGVLLNPSQFYAVSDQNFSWTLEGTLIDNVQGRVLIRNSTNQEDEIDFDLLVKRTSFLHTPVFVNNEIPQGAETLVNIPIEILGVEDDLTYELIITNDEGDGTFRYDGTEHNKGDRVPLLSNDIENGLITGYYKGETVGDNQTVGFRIIASNGVDIKKEADINVGEVGFEFIADEVDQDGYVGERDRINYNIISSSLGTFSLTFKILSGQGDLYDDAGTLLSSTNVYLRNAGLNYMEFEHTNVDTNTRIEVTVRNSVGDEQEQILTFNTEKRDFDFTATPVSTVLAPGSTTDINFAINELAGTSSYMLRYVVNSGSFNLHEGTVEIAENTNYSLLNQGFVLSLADTGGVSIEVTFYVTNFEGLEKEKTVTISVEIIESFEITNVLKLGGTYYDFDGFVQTGGTSGGGGYINYFESFVNLTYRIYGEGTPGNEIFINGMSRLVNWTYTLGDVYFTEITLDVGAMEKTVWGTCCSLTATYYDSLIIEQYKPNKDIELIIKSDSGVLSSAEIITTPGFYGLCNYSLPDPSDCVNF